MTTPIRTCSRCGCTAENLIEFHDRLLCPDCLEEMTEVCVDCGTRFWNRECLTNDHGGPICPDCCDHNYTRCTRCGRRLHPKLAESPADHFLHSDRHKAGASRDPTGPRYAGLCLSLRLGLPR